MQLEHLEIPWSIIQASIGSSSTCRELLIFSSNTVFSPLNSAIACLFSCFHLSFPPTFICPCLQPFHLPAASPWQNCTRPGWAAWQWNGCKCVCYFFLKKISFFFLGLFSALKKALFCLFIVQISGFKHPQWEQCWKLEIEHSCSCVTQTASRLQGTSQGIKTIFTMATKAQNTSTALHCPTGKCFSLSGIAGR